MEKNLRDALSHRRSYYALSDASTVSDKKIIETVEFAVKHIPSAFNSRSARLVLLLHKEHKMFWQIVKDVLKKIVPENKFHATETKIDNCFAAGYGTVLFFEEQNIIKGLIDQFPSYGQHFPQWSDHTSAMHQLALWTMLEEMGFGASLQHYNPIIDQDVKAKWSLPESWKLIAQMPFGLPLEEPGEKEFGNISERIKIFK